MPNPSAPVEITKPQPAGAAAWCMAAYIMIVIGRIGEIIPGLGSVPVAKIAFAFALIGVFSNPKSLSRATLLSLSMAKAGLAFFMLAVLSVTFSIWIGGSIKTLIDGFVTLIVSFIFIVKCGASWPAIRTLHLGFVGAAGLLAFNTLLNSSGGRAGGMSNYDPNDTAFMLVSLTPLVIAYAINERGIKRWFGWGMSFAVIISALLTQSRGGLLGLATISIGMTLFPLATPDPSSPRKRKPFSIPIKLLMMLMAAVLTWNILPGETRARLATIVHPQNDYNMDMNEEGRLAIWQRNLRSVAQRPIGFGVGSFMVADGRVSGRFRAAHNSFVQVLVELGVLGLILYLRAYFVAFREIKRILRLFNAATATNTAQLIALARAVRLALIASMVCGFFLSQAYSNLIWLLLALVASIAATLQHQENQAIKPKNGKRQHTRMSPSHLGTRTTLSTK